jgi:hypothetical protein
MRAIFKRELNSYFHSPIAYVCIGVLLALYGFFYYNVLLLQTSTYISSVYSSMFLFNMLVIPIITMRSFSEERKEQNRSGPFNSTGRHLCNRFRKVSGSVIGVCRFSGRDP